MLPTCYQTCYQLATNLVWNLISNLSPTCYQTCYQLVIKLVTNLLSNLLPTCYQTCYQLVIKLVINLLPTCSETCYQLVIELVIKLVSNLLSNLLSTFNQTCYRLAIKLVINLQPIWCETCYQTCHQLVIKLVTNLLSNLLPTCYWTCYQLVTNLLSTCYQTCYCYQLDIQPIFPTLLSAICIWILRSADIQSLFIPSVDYVGNGDYFLGIGEFTSEVTASMQQSPKTLEFKHMKSNMTVDYELRISSSACYYRHIGRNEWIHGGMVVRIGTKCLQNKFYRVLVYCYKISRKHANVDLFEIPKVFSFYINLDITYEETTAVFISRYTSRERFLFFSLCLLPIWLSTRSWSQTTQELCAKPITWLRLVQDLT